MAGSTTTTRACLVALVVALAFLFSEGAAAGTAAAARRRQVRSLLRRLNKAPLVSIQSPDGDIIDCVHISKQPAFDHPLLKNHTIQMRPSYHPGGLSDDSTVATHPITQLWHQNGKCPENTIPIRRTKEGDVMRASSIKRYGKKRPGSIPKLASIDDPDASAMIGHLHALASASGENYYGTKTTINLWQPTIEGGNGFSLAQLWITRGSYQGNDLNTIEAGWQVFPGYYPDSNTRLFIYWTRDAYNQTGCYNLNCAGFIQTNNQIAIGGSISPVSLYGGSQYDIDILIWKDQKDGNWWLQVGSDTVGYWPSSIFSYLSDSATTVQWGGEVYSPDASQTSSTQMGSGHFPDEGFGKASYIKNIQVVDSSNNLKLPNGVVLIAKRPSCYNVQNGASNDGALNIYYGGPGRSPNCP
ncbi:uncharacterized protein C2845_PM17G06240 [Panicum miliaceum]|uniref:Neprosin PEP catalytic domain-containing protein n=1 Tax=Panicum miliaceum TaxID=4540 RepID=A0A3L6PYS7_PANMI|nr:uncharacterized protein C2845_PM17G06240 [Panicum miliaceum]